MRRNCGNGMKAMPYYTAQGSVGLMGDKKVVLLEARGDIWSGDGGQGRGHFLSVLTAFLHFLGVEQIETMVAEGFAVDPA